VLVREGTLGLIGIIGEMYIAYIGVVSSKDLLTSKISPSYGTRDLDIYDHGFL